MNTADCKSCLYKKRVPVGVHCDMHTKKPTECQDHKPNVLPFRVTVERKAEYAR